MIRVVTTFSQTGWHEYGHHFFATFDKFWPSDVELILYTEEMLRIPASVCGRAIYGCQLADVPGHDDFITELSPYPLLNGRHPTPVWKLKDIADGYSFRTDVIKFCHKVFAVWHAAHVAPHGTLFWIDADVRTINPVPMRLLEQIMFGADVSYLGREHAASECGFIGFNLPPGKRLIDTWHEYYIENKFAAEREWHDSYLFDRAREREPDLRYRSLTNPNGKQRGHVWVNSPLGPFMDHAKGERKKLGYSPEHRARWGT